MNNLKYSILKPLRPTLVLDLLFINPVRSSLFHPHKVVSFCAKVLIVFPVEPTWKDLFNFSIFIVIKCKSAQIKGLFFKLGRVLAIYFHWLKANNAYINRK